MKGLGTILNVSLILFGGCIGLIFGKKIKPQLQTTLMHVMGISICFIGLAGTLGKMLVVKGNSLEIQGSMLMIVSLIIGAIIGELLNLEDKIEQFGEWLKRISKSSSDSAFVNGFVVASCTVCIGAMAVIGAIEDGISGDYTLLLSKGIVDAVIICVMCAAYGKGCVFSAIPVGLFQGSITLLAIALGALIPHLMLDALSLVGSILITCVGINILFDFHIKVTNLLPSLIIAMIVAVL